MRVESSIITSLSELRAIEQQRIADERAAAERRKLADLDAQRAAERARIEAADARARAEREELMRIERARADAEREARLRIEATEAAERNRLAAQLEERRVAEEIELRRAEIAKKRPTWMVGVTIAAGIAAIALAWFAVDRSHQAEQAQAASERAIAARQAALDALKETEERMATLQADAAAIDARIATLTKDLQDAQNADERRKVQLALAAEAKARAAAQQRIDDARRRQDKIDRNQVIDVSKCKDTALGCLEMH
jgi:hypothetical protein